MISYVRSVMIYGFFGNDQPVEFIDRGFSAFELSRQIELVYYGTISTCGMTAVSRAIYN